MKALVIGNANPKIDNISAAQLYPFFDNRHLLQQELDLEFKHVQAVTISEIAQSCEGVKPDILFIRPCWRETPEKVTEIIQQIRAAHPNRKIIFIDPWDQENSRFFGVLPYVDWFLKYQRLKYLNDYYQEYIGGTIITDYLAKTWGIELNGWHVGSPVPQGYADRIMTGWSVGLDKRFKQALFRFSPWGKIRPIVKDIDVFCRMSLGSIHNQEWYGKYRKMAIAALMPLEFDYRLAVSGEFDEHKTIPSSQYFQEIKRSRIVFSPFGWGPITWRDYEAVCYHCLLIKPSMDKIDVKPDIYIPGETYVPVRWDLTDVEEKCRYYLQHWDEAQQIIKNARRAYESYYRNKEFVKTIQKIIGD
jgi:hypothetical protein